MLVGQLYRHEPLGIIGKSYLSVAELYYGYSGYNYVLNNPLSLTDPNGMWVNDGNRVTTDVPEEIAAFMDGVRGNGGGDKDKDKKTTGGITTRTVASGMPANIAFGMGVYGGLQQTGQFLGSLTTVEGWSDLGQGFVNMMQMTALNAQGTFMRANMTMAIKDYTQHIPNMTVGEIAYDAGYGAEKVGEAMLTRKAMPVSKASLGLPKGLGAVSPNTNGFSLLLKNTMGRSPVRIPTLVGYNIRPTKDIGLIMSRNILTPIGYTSGVGQFQYLSIKK